MNNKNARASALALSLLIIAPSVGAEVIVTGSRASVNTISPVSVVTSEEIQNSPLTDINDIIRQTPGIRPPQFTPGGTATIRIRGLDTSASPYYVDGVLIHNPGFDLNTIPTDIIDRVEVLRGPQGTLYGTNSMAGAVNVVTRPDYQAYNPLDSYVFKDLNSDLSQYWLAYDSKEECDATHGSPVPFWTFFPDLDVGGPYVSKDADFWAWGGQDEGYAPPSVYLPQPGAGIELDSDRDNAPTDSGHTYNVFNELRARIRDYPGATEELKSRFIFGLFLGAGYQSYDSLSDDAAATGDLDADAIFQEFVDWSKAQTDAGHAGAGSGAGSTGFYPYAGVEGIPAVPAAGAGTNAPEQPAAPAQAATSDPFGGVVYPPDSFFDLNKCDDTVNDENGNTQLDRMRTFLGGRLQARSDWAARVDFLRPNWMRELDKEKGETPAEAEGRRDFFNDKLRAEWLNCVEGIATAPQAASEDSSRDFSLGIDTDFGNKFNLKVHFEYEDLGDGAPTGPVADIAGRLSQFDFSSKLGLPFTSGAYQNFEYGADSSSSTEYSDALGTMTFADAIAGRRLFAKRPNVGDDYNNDASFGLGAAYDYRSIRARIGRDWNFYVDYDSLNQRGGASVGVRVPYVKTDSVYLETVPGFNLNGIKGNEDNNDESELFNAYGTDYFSFGGKNFYAYTYPEFGGFDFSQLDKELGATYWTNNECGESALPPEGSGYLTAAESPVKKVSDQWAFRHVGLAGDEPTLDEFAKPVVVAVIDTGLDWHHLDFSWDNLWRNENEIPGNGLDDDNNGYVDDIIGWSFTDNRNQPWDTDGHGTAVAGIIAATQGNAAGIDGISGNAKIMVLKALNNFGRTRATHVAKAIIYAADNGAQLINLSVTGPGFPKIVQDAVDYAADKGALVINAAGNKAENIDATPGLLRNVVTVAATGSDNKRAVFSNYGNAVDVAAPGVDVVSLRARATDFMYNSAETSYVKEDAFLGEDRRYYRSTGTSFAAPIVTGIASLVLANNPELKPTELKRVLEQSARDIEAPGFDRLTGFGIVDAKAALAADPSFYIYAGIGAVQPATEDGQTFFEAFGTAAADQLASARLEIGQGDSPTSWTTVGSVLAEGVHNGSLGQIPADSLAGAETWTIRLTVEHANGRTREGRHLIGRE